MKNSIYNILCVIFALFIFNFSLLIPYCMCQWVQVSNGIGNLYVSSLAYSGNNIFAGIGPEYYTGVYISTNNGSTWTQTSISNQSVYSLAVNGNSVFAGTLFYGVFLSTNNGTNWTQTLSNQYVLSLAVNGNYVFAGTYYYGVFLSTNNGTNWTQTSLINDVYSLAVNGNYVFAGTDQNGVFLSTNNGTNWTQTSLTNQRVFSLAVNGNYVFAGTYQNGVFLSTNNGTNWTQTSLNFQSVYALAVNGINILAGTSGFGVYVSYNNGTNWAQRNEGLGNHGVGSFCILNNYIFAGTFNGGVYRRPLGELVAIQPISSEIPNGFSLSQNYPNPFNPVTNLEFGISSAAGGLRFVSLIVYNMLGVEVATLVNDNLNPGTYKYNFDASALTSGVYFYKLVVNGNIIDTKRMVLLK